MEIIDFHTHVFPDHIAPRAIAALRDGADISNRLDGTLGDLKKSMKRNGITRSVLLPIATKPEQVATINRSCPGLADSEVVPFGTLHPRMEDPAAQVQWLSSAGIKGIKLHPEYQDFYIDDRAFFPAYEALQAHGMIVMFHAGKDPGPFTSDHGLPTALRRVMREFPRLRVIASHMGGWRVWDEVEKVLAGQPLWFDMSAVADHLPVDRFVRIARAHGPERIVFGTDSPWYDQGEVRRWLEESPLTHTEKEWIFFRTARALLDSAP